MRPLPPELLRSFVAVAQSGSFTAASERVNLSQSTVSQHIRRLEELLDRPLFERDTRNVHLSQHGDALFRYAVRILELMDEAVTSVCGPPLSGKVRLAMSEDFASAHLTAALASFVRHNPDVELAIFRVAQEALANAVKHGSPPIVVRYRSTPSGISLAIDDAGPGIADDAPETAEQTGRFGLLNMAQRAEQIGAILDVKRWPGGGTHVALEWRPR